LIPQRELNFGVGVNITRASNGVILKSIVAWTFEKIVDTEARHCLESREPKKRELVRDSNDP
jgi:hypothetical protein